MNCAPGRVIRQGIDVGRIGGEGPCPSCHGAGKIAHACILFTAFGGPLAPQEPGDIRRQIEALEEKRRPLLCSMPDDVGEHGEIYAQIVALREKRAAADAFWAEHALSA